MGAGLTFTLLPNAAKVVREIEAEHSIFQAPHMKGLGVTGMGTMEVVLESENGGEQQPYLRLLFIKGKPWTAGLFAGHVQDKKMRAILHAVRYKYDFRI